MTCNPQSRMRVLNLESGLPTVEEAKKRLAAELQSSKQSGIVALKLIHGYGSTGVGGSSRTGIRRSLIRRRKEGTIKAVIFGEHWSIFTADCLSVLTSCPDGASFWKRA